MPSVDQVTELDQSGKVIKISGVKSSHDDDDVLDNHKINEAVDDKVNGTMESKPSKNINAYLVKTDVLCLDKAPIKPVMIETTTKSEVNKMEDRNQMSNGCHGNGDVTGVNQNGSADESEENKKSTSGVEKSAQKDVKSCKKPVSFDLLDSITKQRAPSIKGKVARQRATSDMSYKKQHYPMLHTNSDPTGLDSDNVFEGGNEQIKSEKNEGTDEQRNELRNQVCKNDKDIDQLADSLGSSLQIAPSKQESDKQVSDLADDLSKGLSVKDDDLGSKVIVVKREPQAAISGEEIIIHVKEEPDDAESKSQKPMIKTEPEEGKFSKSVSGDQRRERVARGINENQFPNQTPMTGQHFGQQSYQTTNMTGPVRIPSFQKTFIQQNQMLHHQNQFVQQRVQLQEQIQYVRPPCYDPSLQQQLIILPSSPHHSSKPIVVPPPGSSSAQSNQNYQQYLTQMTVQHSSQMQLQQPTAQPMGMMTTSKRQPEEAIWPDDNPLPPSPQSISSDGTSFISSNPVSPFSNQGSPSAASFAPTSPYQTVPTQSPEMPPINSPQAPSTPGSEYSTSHAMSKDGNNFGVMTEYTDKPSSPKRTRIEDPNKEQAIKDIQNYLLQGSPQHQESEPSASPRSPPHAYQAFSPSSESCGSITPPHNSQYDHYQEAQPSPPHGASLVQPVYQYTRQPQQQVAVIPSQQGYDSFTTTQQVPPSHQQTPVEAVIPMQAANQREYELEEWRQKVAGLTEAQIKEQDEQDKDTILHLAIIHELDCLMRALIERLQKIPDGNKCINIKNKLSQTPVFLAAATNQPEAVFDLIRNGADPTIPGEGAGNTPLHYAAQQGFVGVIQAIFQGFERSPETFINATNLEGKSPLHIAVEAHGTPVADPMGNMETIDSIQTIEILLEYRASALCKDGKSGKTALHYAVEMQKHDITKLLLERYDHAGELVNCQMYNGNTALHLIVGRQSVPMEDILQVVSLLMQYGANVSIENAEKDTAVRLVQHGHNAVKKHLSGQSH